MVSFLIVVRFEFLLLVIQHFTYGSSSSSSSSIKGEMDREFFVELWDVSGHESYKDCRSMFYSQVNGVIFVHDLSQRRTKTSLPKWAAEISATGTFSAPLANGGPGGLPVPYIVIGNKADIASKEGRRNSSGNLVDIARQWVEKQGLHPPSEELPLSDSFPGSGGLLAAAREARYDKESVMKFFRMLVRRRYFSDELPTANPWSTTMQQPLQRSDDSLSDEDHIYTIKLETYYRHFRLNVISPHLRRFILSSQSQHLIFITSLDSELRKLAALGPNVPILMYDAAPHLIPHSQEKDVMHL